MPLAKWLFLPARWTWMRTSGEQQTAAWCTPGPGTRGRTCPGSYGCSRPSQTGQPQDGQTYHRKWVNRLLKQSTRKDHVTPVEEHLKMAVGQKILCLFLWLWWGHLRKLIFLLTVVLIRMVKTGRRCSVVNDELGKQFLMAGAESVSSRGRVLRKSWRWSELWSSYFIPA